MLQRFRVLNYSYRQWKNFGVFNKVCGGVFSFLVSYNKHFTLRLRYISFLNTFLQLLLSTFLHYSFNSPKIYPWLGNSVSNKQKHLFRIFLKSSSSKNIIIISTKCILETIISSKVLNLSDYSQKTLKLEQEKDSFSKYYFAILCCVFERKFYYFKNIYFW